MRKQHGFTYLGVLMAVALLGYGATAVSDVWVATAHRQKMEQLEWVGRQYVEAIGSYYEAAPAGAKVYPVALTDLLADTRYPYARRHLRKLYPNPMASDAPWELVRTPDGRVRGIRTQLQLPGAAGASSKEFLIREPAERNQSSQIIS